MIKSWLSRFKNNIIKMIEYSDAFQKRMWEWRQFFLPRYPSNGEMTAILKRMGAPSFAVYAEAQRQGHYGVRSFIEANRDNAVAQLREQYPEQLSQIIVTAERLLHGQFDVLGSGLRDLRRKSTNAAKLDWSRDPNSGLRFPRVFSHWGWQLDRIKPAAHADIKGPWEIGRLQHFPVLGQAYWVTKDERYATCFANTIDDFMRYNPVGLGVQWACTMDVGLRLVNMIIGVCFFQGSPALTHAWWKRFLKYLVVHGRFIAANLEYGTLNNQLVMGNHFISDLLGLYWLALCFPALDAGVVWRGIAETGLEREIQIQILADGGDYESSVPYHGLVTEIFLSAYALARHHQRLLSQQYREKLIQALRFIKILRQRDGRMPHIGDCDNGRAHLLSNYHEWPYQHMDHLLVAGSHVLGIPQLQDDVLATRKIEALFWGNAAVLEQTLNLPKHALFKESGLAVLRNGASYFLLANTPIGTQGFGNHKHNDHLSFEWIVDGQPIIVDAGCPAYTNDAMARNQFRSTATHNTVMVDHQEQNTFNPQWLFRMEQQGAGTLSEIYHDPEQKIVGVMGQHSAYARLPEPVLHVRRVILQADGMVVLEDILIGKGEHELHWNFQLHPQLAMIDKNHTIVFGNEAAKCGMMTQPLLSPDITTHSYSPSYGTKQEAIALCFSKKVSLPYTQTFILMPKVNPNESPIAVDSLQQHSKSFWNSCGDIELVLENVTK